MPLNFQSIWKRAELALVALAGLAAAIPGMAALGRLKLPAEAQDLSQLVTAVFSAAAVLIVYLRRGTLANWSERRVYRFLVSGFFLFLAALLLLNWLLHLVWVPHAWRREYSRTFVPLFLSDSAERLIERAGSRAQALTQYGADYLTRFTTETNLALTLSVLVVSYTAAVLFLAGSVALGYVWLGRTRSRAG